jgi:hypothetical protein
MILHASAYDLSVLFSDRDVVRKIPQNHIKKCHRTSDRSVNISTILSLLFKRDL